MDRNALAAWVMKIDGVLLLIVAVVHFAATRLALRFVSSQSSPEEYAQIEPRFLLSFVVVGVLLLPVGLSTFYCADSIRHSQRWAQQWTVDGNFCVRSIKPLVIAVDAGSMVIRYRNRRSAFDKQA